jgi:membrane protease YdiL (CAAX protease family)
VRYLGLMLLEAALLAVPLIVFGRLLNKLAIEPAQLIAMQLSSSPGPAPGSTLEWLAMSIGAGLYEELVFRMLIIALLHALLVDVIGAGHRTGTAIAIAVSAILFIMYHWVGGPPQDSIVSIANLFYLAAGVYFGLIYVVRGFGIVAATHALYDIAIAVALPIVFS